MKLRRNLLITGFLFWFFPLFPQNQNSQSRSFDTLFPRLDGELKREAFLEGGVIRSLKPGEPLALSPAPGSGIELVSQIQAKGHAYITESLLVIPYHARPLRVLDAYNSLAKVQGLKGRVYHSFTRDSEIPLFEEAVRLESDRRNNPIPDPPPASTLPVKETVYIRLKDVNFGNSYYRAEITPHNTGLLYNLTNYRTITYLFVPVMREEKFTALLYLEPLEEGMLVYAVAGADVSDFISRQIDIPSAIGKRVAVFIDWVSDGLREFL